MESSNQLYEILKNIATLLPSLLTTLGGIVVAIIRWKRHPRVSLTLVIALVLMLLHELFFAVVYPLLPALVESRDLETMKTIFTLVSVTYNFTLAVFTAILLVAIFMYRKETPPPPSYEPAAEVRAA